MQMLWNGWFIPLIPGRDSNAYSCMHTGNTPTSTRRSATSHSHWLRRFHQTCLCCHDNSKATPCFFSSSFFLHPTIPPPPTGAGAGATMQGCVTWAVERHVCEQPHLWSSHRLDRSEGCRLNARPCTWSLIPLGVGTICRVYEQRVWRVENWHQWRWWAVLM